MLIDLRWAELENRRKNIRLTFLYKIVNNKVEISVEDIDSFVVRRTTRCGSRLGKSDIEFNQKLHLPSAKTNQFQKSFVIRTIPQWNKLPVDILESSSIEAFKNKLEQMLYL